MKHAGAGAGWASMVRAGLRLGITPEAFWRLSLKEWRMVTEAEPGPVLGRAEFERLLKEHG